MVPGTQLTPFHAPLKSNRLAVHQLLYAFALTKSAVKAALDFKTNEQNGVESGSKHIVQPAKLFSPIGDSLGNDFESSACHIHSGCSSDSCNRENKLDNGAKKHIEIGNLL